MKQHIQECVRQNSAKGSNNNSSTVLRGDQISGPTETVDAAIMNNTVWSQLWRPPCKLVVNPWSKLHCCVITLNAIYNYYTEKYILLDHTTKIKRTKTSYAMKSGYWFLFLTLSCSSPSLTTFRHPREDKGCRKDRKESRIKNKWN
jgi:hypothetical protein